MSDYEDERALEKLREVAAHAVKAGWTPSQLARYAMIELAEYHREEAAAAERAAEDA